MNSKLTFHKAVLGLLLLVVIVSLFKISAGGVSGYVSGYVFGVPGGCISQISIMGPSAVVAYPGETLSAEVSIFNVSCGVSYARLQLDAIPDSWYEVSPLSITNIAPGQNKTFTIYLDIPLLTEAKTYSSTYKVYTNEGTFTLGEFELSIIEPEKPKSLPDRILTGSADAKGSKSAASTENTKFWYAVAVVASLLAIVLIGSEHFKVAREEEKAAQKRTGAELSEVLGKTPREKKSFRRILKKEKKK